MDNKDSTRLKNLPGQYCREQTEQHKQREYLVLKEKKVPAVSKLPDFGINAGNMAMVAEFESFRHATPVFDQLWKDPFFL